MFQYDRETLSKVEQQLRVNCPSPESDLAKLGKIVAALSDSAESAKIRRFAFDIDDLIAQTRWHLGQALLLLETQPPILNSGEDDSELVRESGMSTDVQLLLRGYVREADCILYEDLSEPRSGGTVAGWIFHMMIDSAVYRSIAALDRIAHILWYAAKLPMERIYFRSGKIKKLDETLDCAESQELLRIAEGPLINFLINYRDGLTHDAKAYSRIAGYPPTDEWKTPNGKQVFWKADEWNVELLFALGNGAYHQLLDALRYAVLICEKIWPIPPKWAEHHDQ